MSENTKQLKLRFPLAVNNENLTVISYNPYALTAGSYDRVMAMGGSPGEFRMALTDYQLHYNLGVAILCDSNKEKNLLPEDCKRLHPFDRIKVQQIGANFIMESAGELVAESSAAPSDSTASDSTLPAKA